jgi:hypothetical protein
MVTVCDNCLVKMDKTLNYRVLCSFRYPMDVLEHIPHRKEETTLLRLKKDCLGRIRYSRCRGC